MGTALSWFSFSGSATRLQALAIWLVYVILLVTAIFVAREVPLQARYTALPLHLAGWAMLATMARRLHHAGHSGRWAALALVPMAGLIAGLVITFLPQRKLHLRPHNGARALGYGVMVVFLIAGILRLWWVPYWIPSESMKPTLLEGDYIAVRHGQAVQRGDVIVFLHPVTGEAMAKRVVALAGDVVALQGGQVLINDQPLVQLPFGDFSETMGPKGPDQLRPRCRTGVVGDGAVCEKSIYQEMLPTGQKYQIANIADGEAGDNFAPATVPEGAMFLLGDNRDNSLDSRFSPAVGGLGFVPVANKLGHVRRVVFSSAGAQLWAFWTWRIDRFWAEVR
jgi:signal peptidase I